MLWSDYVTQVDAHLVTDATRRGLETFRDRFLRNAVIDLQRFIPGYRVGNTTTYQVADVVAVGSAHLVAFPAGARPTAVYIIDTDPAADSATQRYRLDFYPWLKRQALIDGDLQFCDWWAGCWGGWGPSCQSGPPPVTPPGASWGWACRKGYVYSIGPHGKNFLIYPQLTATTELLLVWDGLKTSFADGDSVPFPDESCEAVAAYIKAKVCNYVDKNVALGQIANQDWKEGRLKLYRDWQETQSMEEKDEEYDATALAPPTNFASFGGQNIPLLRAVTGLTGSATSLDAIPTAAGAVDVPTTVQLYFGGDTQFWTLVAYTGQAGAGTQQPADFDAVTNPVIWLLSP